MKRAKVHVTPHGARAAGALLVALTGALILSACQNPHSPQGQAPFKLDLSELFKPKAPKPEKKPVESVRDVVEARRETAEAFAAARLPLATRSLIVQVLVLPKHVAKVNLAATMLEEPEVGPGLLRLWETNGLRLGRLDRTRLNLFLANLPKVMDWRTMRIPSGSDYVPVTLVDRISGAQRLRVAGPEGGFEMITVVGGRHQLLVKLVEPLGEGPGAVPLLDVLPHHHGVRAALVPRMPQERVLDGTSFPSLRLLESLDDQSIWVICPILKNAKAQRTARRRPLTLAEAMLSGRRLGRDICLVVLLSLEPRP